MEIPEPLRSDSIALRHQVAESQARLDRRRYQERWFVLFAVFVTGLQALTWVWSGLSWWTVGGALAVILMWAAHGMTLYQRRRWQQSLDKATATLDHVTQFWGDVDA